MKSENIYIIQTYSQTIPSKIVKLVTRYKYSHIGICLNKNCDITYSFGRTKTHNFLKGGFVVEHKDGEFYKKFNKTLCRIYELKIDEEKYEQIKEHLHYMKLNKNIYKYDFLGAILRTFYIPVRFNNRYVCSQFVAEVLEKFNIYKFDKDLKFIKPKDFDIIDNIKEIYIGEYLAYHSIKGD